MTPDQAQTLIGAMSSLILSQDVATRAALASLGHDIRWLVSMGDESAARYLVQNATNPTGSTLTSDQFAALKAQLLALFPSN